MHCQENNKTFFFLLSISIFFSFFFLRMSSFVSSLLSKSVNTIVGSSRHQDPSLQSLAKYEGVHNVDRKGISAGVKLISIAVEEFACGNQAIALDIYLSGLDKIIMSLPSK